MTPEEVYKRAIKFLGLKEPFTDQDLENKRKSLSLVYHPDKNPIA
jgi:hypothetical protein